MLYHSHKTVVGGLGLQMLDEVIVGEELAYGCTGISTAVAANMLAVSLSSSTQKHIACPFYIHVHKPRLCVETYTITPYCSL